MKAIQNEQSVLCVCVLETEMGKLDNPENSLTMTPPAQHRMDQTRATLVDSKCWHNWVNTASL